MTSDNHKEILYKESGFNDVLAEVQQLIISDFAKADFAKRLPAKDLPTAEKRLLETQEAMALLGSGQHVPFMGMANISRLTEKIKRGQILEAEELTIRRFPPQFSHDSQTF